MKKSLRFGCVPLLFATFLCPLRADEGIKVLPDGAVVPLASGETVEVRFLNDKIAQVAAWPKDGHEPGPSYVVNLTSADNTVRVHQDPTGEVEVDSASLKALIETKTGAVTFQDLSGHALLAEQGRQFVPVTVNKENTFQVQQAWASQPDESLFGLGQHQDGIWNWRGLPVELQQQNTCVAVPFVISTRGYGILWDNAARTTFNPVDQNIDLVLENPESVEDSQSQPKATEDLIKPVKKGPRPLAIRGGTFTTGEAGEYVFFAQNGDRSKEFSILVDDKPVAGIVNMWVPYTVSGTVKLPAHTQVKVTLRGGGKNPVLSARLRETGQTVFRSRVGDAVDYYFFYGPSMPQIIADYRAATGDAPLLPLWAYGFWQCREHYASQAETLAAAQKYRDLHIPVDLIIQDWQYWGTHGWGAYQWDEKRYPDPAGMIKQLHDLNVKYMISVWPNPSGPVHDALTKIPHGLIGPYYDAYNPEARKVRWDFLNKAFFSIGTDAWWQDAAEPGDPGADVYGHDTSIGSGDRHALAYPLFHSECLYDNQRQTDPGKRVVNLTRSGYSGQQRYSGAVWSGDINGDWVTMRRQITAGLQFSLSGLPYWTTDCAGFFHPGGQYTSPDYNELLARWFEWSTFVPIQRVHGSDTHTEFWNWLAPTQNVLISYDVLRHRMLPYIYSLAWQVTHDQSTFMRPLVMDFPDDVDAVAISDEYLFGPFFLVAPVTEPKATSRNVYLPKGTKWIDFWTGEIHEGGTAVTTAAPLEQIPLFLRAGSIVPFGPDVQYATEKPADPIELRIYPGADGDFELYEDQGDSYDYEKGAFATIPLHWNDVTQTLVLGNRKGDFPGMLKSRTFQVTLVNPQQGTGLNFGISPNKVIKYDGSSQEISLK